jgi:hypothetical protein
MDLQPYKPPETDLAPMVSGDAKVRTSRRWWPVPYLYPLVLVGSFYGTWLIAWCELGHMPIPSVDDPNSIGGVTSVFVGLPILVAMLIPGMLALGFVFLFYLRPNGNEQYSYPRWWLMLTSYVLLWFVTFWIIRWDPLGVFEWYGD